MHATPHGQTAHHPVNHQAHAFYSQLMDTAVDLPNSHILACMLVSQAFGNGVMPPGLGLTPAAYQALLHSYFPKATLTIAAHTGERDSVRQPEIDDLRTLLLAHRADAAVEREWMADILVAGCLGNDHLWQDLGLWTRSDLTALIRHNFPTLAARNDRDMKWKKFFYKQLCLAEGVYVCRAPSCEVCVDYQHCFGAED